MTDPSIPPHDVVLGAAAVLGGHSVIGGGCVVLAAVGNTPEAPMFLVPIFMIGLFQLVYVVPLGIWAMQRDRKGVLWGALGAAAITGICNGGCWGMLAL